VHAVSSPSSHLISSYVLVPYTYVTLEAWGWSSRLSRRGRVAMKTEQKERLGAHKLMGRMGRGAAFVALYTFPSR
jgi:hypothetical protein